jgi:hypothetical protein
VGVEDTAGSATSAMICDDGMDELLVARMRRGRSGEAAEELGLDGGVLLDGLDHEVGAADGGLDVWLEGHCGEGVAGGAGAHAGGLDVREELVRSEWRRGRGRRGGVGDDGVGAAGGAQSGNLGTEGAGPDDGDAGDRGVGHAISKFVRMFIVVAAGRQKSEGGEQFALTPGPSPDPRRG